MLKLRLKRIGRKRSPSYRLVIMENATRRDGRPIEEVGYYDPISKKYKFDSEKIQKWLGHIFDTMMKSQILRDNWTNEYKPKLSGPATQKYMKLHYDL
jgi:small subunit ribosomal protein S16